HRVEQQLHAEGDLSYVQFQLLARLAAARGQLSMTELADGVVYSRSGLTYQAGLLEKAGLLTPAPLPPPPQPRRRPRLPSSGRDTRLTRTSRPGPSRAASPTRPRGLPEVGCRPPQHIAAPSLPVTAPIPGLAGRRVSSCMRGQRFPARYRYCTAWSRWR